MFIKLKGDGHEQTALYLFSRSTLVNDSSYVFFGTSQTAVVYFSKFENSVSPTVDSGNSNLLSSLLPSSAHQLMLLTSLPKTNSSDVYPIRVKESVSGFFFEETIERNHSEQEPGY